MTEKKEYKGMWFRPDRPDEQVAGILYFTPNESIKLELIGSLGNKSGILLFTESNSFPVIHGKVYGDNKAENITLFDCSFSGSYNPSCGFALSKYTCTYLLVGKLINGKEEKLFDRMQVYFPCLNDWYPYRPIKHNITFQNDDNVYQWEISHGDKYLKSFAIDNQTNLILNAIAGYYEPSNSSFSLYEDAYLEIESNIKSSFTELYHKAYLFRDFLSLAVLTDVPFKRIVLYDNDDYQPLENNKKYLHITQLFFVVKKHSTDKYPRYNYLFGFLDIEHVFAKIISKWYHQNNLLAPIRQHLINSITHKREFSSIDFLIVIQAIEGYYSRFINKDEQLTNVINNLYNKFNNITMIQNSYVGTNKIVDSRNYYSHFFDKHKKKNVCDGLELYEITSKLRLLLICCVLSLIGFSNDEINKFLNNSNILQREFR